MQIELGLIALLFCVSIAIQIRFFNLFEKRLARLFAKSEESEKRKREEDEAAQRIRDVMNGDVEKFEHRYSRRFPFAIPNSLPVVPAQAHFDSKNSSPSLPSHITSFSNSTTPKSENAPLLPELNYVTTASKRLSTQPSDATLAIKPSESNKSFFSQMKSLMSSTSGNNKDNDVPPVPSLNRSTSEEGKKTSTEAANLEQEIAEREQALQKIKTIRESIDQMRTNLKSQSQDGSASTDSGTASLATAAPSSETIAPAPPTAATKPANHRHSVSFTGISDPVSHRSPTMASFTAPRPLSQHSMLVTQQHARGPSAPPMQSHSRSSSQQTLSRPRPISSYSNRGESATHAGSPGMQSRRQSTMSMDTGRTSLTTGTGEIQHSQRIFFAEPSRYSTGPPQRVVTGVMPARMPSQDSTGSPIIAGSTAPQRQSMVRTQTMDILDLHAKHRRRMSDLQNTATIGTGKSSVAEPKSATMTSSASQPSFKTVGPARKRSSTVTGLSSLPTTSLPADAKKQKSGSASVGIDELGRRPSPTIRTGISPSATMPVNATSRSAPSPKLPTSARPSVGARTGVSLEAARDSEAAWLSY